MTYNTFKFNLFLDYRASGGVVLDRSSIKIDDQGYVDIRTGERYQRVIADDIEVSKATS